MRRVLALLLLTPTTAGSASQPPRHGEIESVAAFARLYGVVRYFYPSDAAAALDRDRFAAHGVTQVRAAHDTSSLQRVLTDLFSPLGPGLAIGRDLPPAQVPGGDDDRLIAWRYLGPGFATAGTPGPTEGSGRTGHLSSPRSRRLRHALPRKASAGMACISVCRRPELGTIVGSTTAQAPFHLVGVRPDVTVEPTIASVRDGSDLVLERAL